MTCTVETISSQAVNPFPNPVGESEHLAEHHSAAQTFEEISHGTQNLGIRQSGEQHQHPAATLTSEGDENNTPSPASPARPETCKTNEKAKSMFSFLLDTRIGNAIGILGLPTLGLTLFSGITAYRDMRWSERANAVQTCASLYVCHTLRV